MPDLARTGNGGFFDKLQRTVARTGSLLCVGLDPDPSLLPERFHAEADPLLAWNLAIIHATADLACVFKPNIAFYEALGRQGFDLLTETLAALPPEVPLLLDAKRGDIGSTEEAYARALYDHWGADAVTVSPYLGGESLSPLLERADKGVFVLCHTSNPGAEEFQGLMVDGRPLYEAVAERAVAWNRHGNVGLVMGATYPERLAAVRGIAPEMWLLVPGVGAQGGDLDASLHAGLTAGRDGLLISVSRSLALARDIRAYALQMNAAISAVRQAAPAWRPIVHPEVERLALALHDIGCVQFGDFVLHSGQHSPIYIDLRLLPSDLAALHLALRGYNALLRPLECDRIAGIPYAALPIATAVSMALNKPLLYPRKEAKAHGTGRAIEGHYRPGETIAVLDDLITNGASKLEAIAPLEEAGLKVRDIVVLIDREQGGAAQLAERGYRLHAVMGIRLLLEVLHRHERITGEQHVQVLDFLGRTSPALNSTVRAEAEAAK